MVETAVLVLHHLLLVQALQEPVVAVEAVLVQEGLAVLEVAVLARLVPQEPMVLQTQVVEVVEAQVLAAPLI